MSFAATNRVKVTNQSSQFRNKLGTVLTAAADTPSNLNAVRLDGYPANHSVQLADGDLHLTGFASPVTYG